MHAMFPGPMSSLEQIFQVCRFQGTCDNIMAVGRSLVGGRTTVCRGCTDKHVIYLCGNAELILSIGFVMS